MEGDQASDHRLQRRDRIAQAEPHPRRRAVRLPGDEAQSPGRLGNRPERRLIPQRPRLAVPRNPHHDEAGIEPDQVLGVQVPRLEPTGPEVLDEDVALRGELADEVLVGRVMEIGGHRQLAARLDEVPQRVGAVPRHPPLPERVSPVRVLDLDDLRAEVREDAAGEGSGNQGAEFQNPEVSQRASLRHRPSGAPVHVAAFRMSGHGSSIWTSGNRVKDLAGSVTHWTSW